MAIAVLQRHSTGKGNLMISQEHMLHLVSVGMVGLSLWQRIPATLLILNPAHKMGATMHEGATVQELLRHFIILRYLPILFEMINNSVPAEECK